MENSIKVQLDTFFANYKQQAYKKGETLIKADETPSGVFYLEEGFVKQYLISKKGDEFILNIFKPGAFFPMSWAINDTPNTFFFEALTPVKVRKASKEKVVIFVKNNAAIIFDLLSRVYRGTDGLLLRMAYLMSGDAYERLITELLIQISRFGKKESNGTITITTTEKELATQVGITRETISRKLKQLKEKGIVVFSQGKITILSRKELEAELL